MRRLRTLFLFAGHRLAAAGVSTRPDDLGPSSGRVDRRRLLGLIGLAPMAAPALARAATAPEPFSSTVFFDVDGSYAASLARYHSALDGWADGVQAWRDAPIPPPPRFDGCREVPLVAARPARPLPVAEPRAHLDDVGSGP